MTKRVEYDGDTIESLALQLVLGDPWQLRIVLALEDYRGMQQREFH